MPRLDLKHERLCIERRMNMVEADEYGRGLGSETELRPFNDRRLELCELLFGNRACRR
jgi:hypothetical protein